MPRAAVSALPPSHARGGYRSARAGLRIAVALSAAALAGGCTAMRTANAPAPRTVPPPPVIEKRTPISSYTTRDWQNHAWTGTVTPLGPDSLLLETSAVPASGLSNGAPARRLVIARSEVVDISRANPAGPIFGVLVFGAIATVLVIYASGLAGFQHW